MKVRTWYDFPHDVEEIVGESMTIPDQSLSVRDILMRYTRGQLDLSEIETGDDDDYDTESDEFEDLVDAQESFVRGLDLQRDIVSSRKNSPGENSSGENSPGENSPVENSDLDS